MKPRLCAQGGVANARDTARYRCALRLALNANPSVSFRSDISVSAYQYADGTPGFSAKSAVGQRGISVTSYSF